MRKLMKKIICQNCYEVLAERNDEELRYDPIKTETIVQDTSKDECILTFACPKCRCMVQVRV